MSSGPRRLVLALSVALVALGAGAAGAGALEVNWMAGFRAPGTPARYDKVGVIKVGPARAKNVLVLEPGTSAGAAYFVPLARWIVSRTKGWQVWSVERRENLLEDQSELILAKQHRASVTQLFDYYLGFLKGPSIKHHVQLLSTAKVAFARGWGTSVAVEDLHRVILAAKKLGGKVVLGGHSLGGALVTAYATWDFGGRAGADALAGLVYIDGGRLRSVTAQKARAELQALDMANSSPWESIGGIPAPLAGLFTAVSSTAVVLDPDGPSPFQSSGLLPADLTPPVAATNLAQFGFPLNVKTSPSSLALAQAHLGQGLAAAGNPRGWNSAGALTPITRFAQMFSGSGIQNADGSEWYFPLRLSLDTRAIDNGKANPAQTVFGEHATEGHRLPRTLLIYAFGAHLQGQAVLQAVSALAKQSRIPASNLTLVNRQSTYAHNDPAGAYPTNAFFAHLVPFLDRIAGHQL